LKNGIIIEGADQQFKSSICEKISEATGMPIIHYGLASDGYDYCEGYFRDVDKYETGLIFDRSYMSEIVYGPVMRNSCNITLEKKKIIEDRFNELGYFLVVLERENPNWVITREEYVSRDIFDKIIERYREVYTVINIEKYFFDPAIESSLENILKIWRRKKDD